MVSINLADNQLTAEFTANAAISDQEVVALTGADAVEPATDTESQETVGVANESAASGDTVEVVLLGRKTVTADGAISAGNPVRAASTAGRVVAETSTPASHTHNVPSDGSGSTADAEISGGTLGVAGGGATGTGDAAPDHSRIVGKAIGSASGAGDALDILVVLTG